MADPCPLLPAEDPRALDRAAQALLDGRLIGVPTETVYGLAGDATNPDAVAAIFAAKGRPAVNPLIVHVADRAAAQAIATFDAGSRRLADRFWPGPLTLVLPLRQGHGLAQAVTAGLTSVAVRVPRGVLAHLSARTGRPIAAPSANPSGRLTGTDARRVANTLGDRLALVLDGGRSEGGVESTIVQVRDGVPHILREGCLPAEALEEAVGTVRRDTRPEGTARPASPGQLLRHYAPSVPVRLDAREVRSGEALLAFAGRPDAAHAVAVRDLSPGGDLVEAAHNLFAYLAELEVSGAAAIAVAPLPDHGLGRTINDRLARAAAATEGEDA